MTSQRLRGTAFTGATGLVALVAAAMVWSMTTSIAAAAPNTAAPNTAVGVATTATPKSTTTPAKPKPRCTVKPTMTVPKGKKAGKGQRIVYSERRMHVWVFAKNGCLLRDYRVTGRADWPKAGSYKVFSKSRSSRSTKYHVTFNYMVRFAHGRTTAIGFHDIPKKNGRPIQRESQLGKPLGLGGCVRASAKNAKWLYGWAKVGTRVYVVR